MFASCEILFNQFIFYQCFTVEFCNKMILHCIVSRSMILFILHMRSFYALQ